MASIKNIIQIHFARAFSTAMQCDRCAVLYHNPGDELDSRFDLDATGLATTRGPPSVRLAAGLVPLTLSFCVK